MLIFRRESCSRVVRKVFLMCGDYKSSQLTEGADRESQSVPLNLRMLREFCVVWATSKSKSSILRLYNILICDKFLCLHPFNTVLFCQALLLRGYVCKKVHTGIIRIKKF